MKEKTYSDADFNMRARFYVETVEDRDVNGKGEDDRKPAPRTAPRAAARKGSPAAFHAKRG
jgi:hypothetical protein